MQKNMVDWINNYIDKEKKKGENFINKIESKYKVNEKK